MAPANRILWRIGLLFPLLLLGAMAHAEPMEGATPAALSPTGDAADSRLVDAQVSRVVTEWFYAMKTRNAEQAFGHLSPGLKSKYDAKPSNYMKTMRITASTLYNHLRADPVSLNLAGDVAIQKLRIIDSNNIESLAIIHLVRGQDGVWTIDRTIVIGDMDARGA